MEQFRTWAEVAPDLVNTAAGRAPADTIIKNGKWVNVHTREVLDGYDIAVRHGRIACVVPDTSAQVGPDTEIIDAAGRYMIPGLCDGHMHIESGMLTPAEFAQTCTAFTPATPAIQQHTTLQT